MTLLEKTNKQFKGDQANQARDLFSILARKQALADRARRDIQLKATLQLWLYLHVPMSIALIAALTAHIVSVFFYW